MFVYCGNERNKQTKQKNMKNLTTLAIGTKVKFVNGNEAHWIEGVIIDTKITGDYVSYKYSHNYGDNNQHEYSLWLGAGNVREIIK